MTPQETHISVIDPISPALERVKIMLFKPFDFGKWFVIGFCAWLAYLGSRGGPNFNFGGGQRFGGPPGQAAHHARDVVVDNLFWIIPVAIIVFLVMIAIGFVITWLSSRGHFMFLHCVAHNKAQVKLPWRKFKRQGNSLFLFRIVVGLIIFAFFMLLIAMLVGIGVLLFAGRGEPHALPIIFMVLLAICLIIPAAIVAGLIMKFTRDFVVPIMFLRQGNCIAAWREFWKLLTANKGKFALYILFQIVIALAVGTIVFACVCITCCCLGCILAIPYIGTVLMLPVLIFDRSYTLYYLRQYGTAFDVFIPATATT